MSNHLDEREICKMWWFEQPIKTIPQFNDVLVGWQACAEQKDAVIAQQAAELKYLREYIKDMQTSEGSFYEKLKQYDPDNKLSKGRKEELLEFWQAGYYQKAAELESLRGFALSLANVVHLTMPSNYIYLSMREHKLIDENGNPTSLLSGDAPNQFLKSL